MQLSEDTAMLSALKDNSLDAYQYFFTKYYKPLCIKACQILGSMEKAKTMVQKLFIEVWKTGSYKHIQHSPGGFFYQLVCERCREIQAEAARMKTQCPPCKTGPALIPTALQPQIC
jgi:hypothetical protein